MGLACLKNASRWYASMAPFETQLSPAIVPAGNSTYLWMFCNVCPSVAPVAYIAEAQSCSLPFVGGAGAVRCLQAPTIILAPRVQQSTDFESGAPTSQMRPLMFSRAAGPLCLRKLSHAHICHLPHGTTPTSLVHCRMAASAEQALKAFVSQAIFAT